MDETEQLKHLLEVALSADVVPQGSGPAQLGDLLRVYRNNIRAVEGYLEAFTPDDVSDHPVALFRPVREIAAGQDSSFGWPVLVGDQLSVHIVPGDHFSVLTQPQVSVLGERLRAVLDRWER